MKKEYKIYKLESIGNTTILVDALPSYTFKSYNDAVEDLETEDHENGRYAVLEIFEVCEPAIRDKNEEKE